MVFVVGLESLTFFFVFEMGSGLRFHNSYRSFSGSRI